jgi:polyribonucleotide 5'-hydroxyl-kinase
MDPEAVDGWGSTPTSGPSSVPVKLPLVFYYGRASPDEDPDFYRELTSKLAGSVSARLSEDEDVKKSGVIIDGMGLPEQSKDGFELVAHIVDEFSGASIHVMLAEIKLTCYSQCHYCDWIYEY